MKFSLIPDIKFEYPEININDIFVKYFMFYYINKKINYITNINIEINNPNFCKFTIKFNLCGKESFITFEMSESNIHYITCEQIDENIKKLSYNTHNELFDHVFNYINQENQSYKQLILNNSDQSQYVDPDRAKIFKLKEDAMKFINNNMHKDSVGQTHLLVNLLTYEFEYYQKNKNNFKFTLEVDNLFHWDFKYNNIEFEFVMVPSVHPLIPPIIDFKKIYQDHSLLMALVTQPYIIRWNSYHSILRLAENFVSIIQNYEKSHNEEIVEVLDEANFMLNTFIKMKRFPSFEQIDNIYENIYIEDHKSGIDQKINIVVNMIYNENSSSERYKSQIETCNSINLMYFNRLSELKIELIDKVVLELISNIPNINNNLKEKIKNYI
jgi:hypothetical protein